MESSSSVTPIPSEGVTRLSHDRPYLVLDEREPDLDEGAVNATTIFLTGSACPVGCSMCDLHQFTLPGPTPHGAIPKQMDVALSSRPRNGCLKLYNSGNFFDPTSIPPADYDAIASRCEGFSRLVVENHPRFGPKRLQQFQEKLPTRLEVAVGLETVQPRWLDRIEKQMTRDQFDHHARWLSAAGVDLRVFLIFGVPGGTVSEALRWTRLSVRHAISASARHISLIPAREGQGWKEHGRKKQGKQLPPITLEILSELQNWAIRDADGRASVTIDLWGIGSGEPGLEKLQSRNLTQQVD